jgi:hypothetical protein
MNKPVGDLKPESEVAPDPLELLRRPFPDHQVSKLPKETKAQADERKADQDKGKWPARCAVCGGLHHARAVHLDYVGHAALTDRLLDVDPHWTWEPVALRDGLPAFDAVGGLWIKLTVCGVTRLGYGAADGKKGGDAVKEIIGDALRNAAMRFGAALDLWHKGDLHVEEEAAPAPSLEEKAITHLRTCAAVGKDQFVDAWEANKGGWKATLETAAWARVIAEMKRLAATFLKEEPKPEPAPQTAAPTSENDFGLGDDDLPEGLR